jgi:hypothetical protein
LNSAGHCNASPEQLVFAQGGSDEEKPDPVHRR